MQNAKAALPTEARPSIDSKKKTTPRTMSKTRKLLERAIVILENAEAKYDFRCRQYLHGCTSMDESLMADDSIRRCGSFDPDRSHVLTSCHFSFWLIAKVSIREPFALLENELQSIRSVLQDGFDTASRNPDDLVGTHLILADDFNPATFLREENWLKRILQFVFEIGHSWPTSGLKPVDGSTTLIVETENLNPGSKRALHHIGETVAWREIASLRGACAETLRIILHSRDMGVPETHNRMHDLPFCIPDPYEWTSEFPYWNPHTGLLKFKTSKVFGCDGKSHVIRGVLDAFEKQMWRRGILNPYHGELKVDTRSCLKRLNAFCEGHLRFSSLENGKYIFWDPYPKYLAQ